MQVIEHDLFVASVGPSILLLFICVFRSVKVVLRPFSLTYEALDIPLKTAAHSRSTIPKISFYSMRSFRVSLSTCWYWKNKINILPPIGLPTYQVLSGFCRHIWNNFPATNYTFSLYSQASSQVGAAKTMSVQAPGFSNPRPRVRVSSQKWEQLRPVVKNLYCDQGKTLVDTRKILKDVYGLTAS